jgi:medium-chain acyl-[acyl-carrier-protein] hydrolase
VVYAFGEAGTGAAAWKGFRAGLVDQAEVRAIRLPGRESRYHDRPVNSVQEQLDDLADELAALVDRDERPYILVGLCVGSLTAFELARHLTARDGHRPGGLIAGQQRAPAELPGDATPVHEYSKEEFRAWCEEYLADRPELGTPATLDFFAPMLQADFSIVPTYRYEPLPLLNCAVTAVCEDEEAEYMRGWADVTDGEFSLRSQADRVTIDSLMAPTVDQITKKGRLCRPV